MKYILLLTICFLMLPICSQGQNRAIKNFYHKYKKYEGTHRATLPGGLIWMGTGIAKKFVDHEENPEAKVFLKFARKFKTMRVLVMEEENLVSKDDLNQLVAGAKKGNYEEIISFRGEGQNISIMGRSKGNKFKNLLILVSGEDQFVMLNAKTNIRVKDINRLIHDLMELEKVKAKFRKQKEEELPPTPPAEEKKKIPIRA